VKRVSLGAVVAAAFCVVACFGNDTHPLVHEQRLPSGRVVKVISCLLAWGVEHDERHPDQDAFALEYVSGVPRERSQELEREALEAFELIRPISEQWGLSTATVTALRTPQRTGTYDVFAFTRSAAGTWSHTIQPITRND
jgi:hypothetical protein